MCQNENYLEFREISLNSHNISRNFFGHYINHIIVGWSETFLLAIFISYRKICPPPKENKFEYKAKDILQKLK